MGLGICGGVVDDGIHASGGVTGLIQDNSKINYRFGGKEFRMEIDAAKEVNQKAARTGDRDANCYTKAVERGQRTFTLVAQDVSAPVVIAEWIKQNIMTCPVEKLHQAIEDAVAMRDYPKRKHAD